MQRSCPGCGSCRAQRRCRGGGVICAAPRATGGVTPPQPLPPHASRIADLLDLRIDQAIRAVHEAEEHRVGIARLQWWWVAAVVRGLRRVGLKV
eukprot:gene351-biopygen22588